MSEFIDETYKRVEEIIIHKRLNIRSFEELINVSNNSIGSAIRRKSAFKSNVLNKILQTFPEIDPTWLLTGKGSMFLENDKTAILNDTPLEYTKIEFKDKVKSVLLELFLEEDVVVKEVVKKQIKNYLEDK
ncbi:hypothetical protein [uncultured Tenacibaculum sp.]|uniref:hypothetical protein n=1 Tax=uncultured Tenacibaculum sp. TaxID=174713 RepID=UPI002602DBDD|nr:hypothetical protein [uncultured Tenacibaculum sp.]